MLHQSLQSSQTLGQFFERLYITHKCAYELFLVLKVMAVYLFHAWQYGVTVGFPLHFNQRALFLKVGIIVAVVGHQGP